jgi:hypothetical protein
LLEAIAGSCRLTGLALSDLATTARTLRAVREALETESLWRPAIE